MLTAGAGCSSTDSGVAGAPDAQSDASLGPPRVIGGPTLSGATECAAAGGQCEVGAVCGTILAPSAGACGPGGAVCCLQVLCGADATVQLIVASDYDQSCAADSDCVEVHVGNACSCALSCQTTPAAINKAALPRYTADVAKSPHVVCSCPPPLPPPDCVDDVPGPHCVGGSCQLTGCPNQDPAGDAAANGGTDAATDAAADAAE
jgi:hypothetical protein